MDQKTSMVIDLEVMLLLEVGHSAVSMILLRRDNPLPWAIQTLASQQRRRRPVRNVLCKPAAKKWWTIVENVLTLEASLLNKSLARLG